MKSKHTFALVILVLALLGYGGYLVWDRRQVLAAQVKGDREMAKFQRILRGWIKAIKKARSKETPGWEAWYIANPEERKEANRKVKSAALYQILENEPHNIPAGYEIRYTGDRFELLEEL